MLKTDRIYIAGHNGLVGSAIVRKLKKEGFSNLIVRTSQELDLTNQAQTTEFFQQEKPKYVFLCAAKVGGIMANSNYPAEFLYQNLMIGTNVIHAAYQCGVEKLLNLGSSCIYPRNAPQPMKEECLLSSALEKTNEGYALAKISAIKMCHYYNQQYGTNFISAMPTNQYGIGDNFNMETAHLLPMLMRRFHLAKLLSNSDFPSIIQDLKTYPLGWGIDEEIDFSSTESLEKALNKIGAFRNKVVVWGDGSVFRELMSSDELADACFYLMQNADKEQIGEFVNITSGEDIQLKRLFEIVKNIVEYQGVIEYDTNKPNGTPKKQMDAQKIQKLGWKTKESLQTGIHDAYRWYLTSIGKTK